jgi:hypothetical protein
MRSFAAFSILCSLALASQVIAAAPNGGGSGGAAAASSGASVHGGMAPASGAGTTHGTSAPRSGSSTHDTASPARAQQLQLPLRVRYAAMRAVRQPSPTNLARLKRKLRDCGYQQQAPDSHVFCPAGEQRARVGYSCIDISRLGETLPRS